MKHHPALSLIWIFCCSSFVSADVTVQNIPCGVEIRAGSVKSVSHYSFRRRIVNNCLGGFLIVPMWTESLGSSSEPSLTLDATPSFTGYYDVDAVALDGTVLSTQSTPLLVDQPAAGRFWHEGSAMRLEVLPNERLVICLGYSVPANSLVEWYRNGEMVQSGLQTDLPWVVTDADHGAIFVPRVYGECGPSDGFGRLMQVQVAPSSTLVLWEGARHKSAVSQNQFGVTLSDPCPICSVRVTTRTEGAFPSASCIGLGVDSFAAGCTVGVSNFGSVSASTETRVQFTVLESARLQISGVNRLPSGFFSPPCGTVSVGISGPLSASFPSTPGAWGPIELELVPGRYSIVAGGSAGTWCTGNIYTSCNGSLGVEISGSFSPIEFRVPHDFATIQGAIDAIPAGEAKVIRVAAGVYHQSFSLNGKDVIVRGAADGTTILDGTGLPTSIVTMSNEPVTAGLENLVFRNGMIGSRLHPEATFTVGGAIYANNTAAFIRNCRFENCRADFGGAIYQFMGSITWDHCAFSGNTANSDGGGALTYNCTGTLWNCVFTGNRCGTNGPGSGSGFKAVGSNGASETVTIDSCAFIGNSAGDSGSAIEFYEHVEYHPGVLRVVNTTVTGNTSGDPVLWGAAGLRVLGQQSSCVLSGTTSICSNAPFNVDGPFLLEVPASVCDCLADLNGDGVVSGGDLGLLLNAWGPTAPSGAGDVNHDGLVDGADLALMLNSWGFCP